MSSRSTLRADYRAKRRAVRGAVRRRAESRIHEHLETRCGDAHTIGAYLASDGEVDLAPWLSSRPADVTIALPRVGGRGEMELRAWRAGDPLERNRYGIDEPPADAAIVHTLNVIFVPLVAFDDAGNRLGMGGGYYDRFLARTATDALLVGVAFEVQHHPEPLPSDTWDVALDAVVTEGGVFEFAGSRDKEG